MSLIYSDVCLDYICSTDILLTFAFHLAVGSGSEPVSLPSSICDEGLENPHPILQKTCPCIVSLWFPGHVLRSSDRFSDENEASSTLQVPNQSSICKVVEALSASVEMKFSRFAHSVFLFFEPFLPSKTRKDLRSYLRF